MNFNSLSRHIRLVMRGELLLLQAKLGFALKRSAYVGFALLFAGLVIFWRIRVSRFGAALQAARQNELRVAAVGIEPFPIRLVAFALSAMITAVAGAWDCAGG